MILEVNGSTAELYVVLRRLQEYVNIGFCIFMERDTQFLFLAAANDDEKLSLHITERQPGDEDA